MKNSKTSNVWKCRVFVFCSAKASCCSAHCLCSLQSSGSMISLSTICSFLPQLLISPFAGVWADRHSRKAIILLSDGCISAVNAMLPQLVSKEKLMKINGLNDSLGASISFAAPISGGAILSTAPVFLF